MSLDLTTRYLGLTLKNPLVVGACPLNYELDSARRNEDAGAAAIVVPSLQSDRLEAEETGLAAVMDGPADGFAEALDFFPDTELVLGPQEHLERIRSLKETLEIPVIASLSGSLESDWDSYASLLADTGADAMEINLGLVPADPMLDSTSVEEQLLEVVARVKANADLPLAVKLPPWFTSLAHFAARLESTGVTGLILFSRFQETWIDTDELELRLEYAQSSRADLPLRMRWLAILSAQRKLDLAISGGVQTGHDAISALMAGASAVQMVSEVLNGGASRIGDVLEEVTTWFTDSDYRSIGELEGCMNIDRCPDPAYYLQHEPVKDLMRYWGHRR
jgi:dihydroorotate dehydrogenase (fumarate)